MTNREAIEFLKNMIDRESVGFVAPKGDGDVAIWQYHVEALQMAIAALEKQESGWNNHKVACLLAEMFGDDCACNSNGIDEWLPMKCDFAETACPNPGGVACWEQFLKHRSDEHGADDMEEG